MKTYVIIHIIMLVITFSVFIGLQWEKIENEKFDREDFVFSFLFSFFWPILYVGLLIGGYFKLIVYTFKYLEKTGLKVIKNWITKKVNEFKLKYLIQITKDKTYKEVYKMDFFKWF